MNNVTLVSHYIQFSYCVHFRLDLLYHHSARHRVTICANGNENPTKTVTYCICYNGVNRILNVLHCVQYVAWDIDQLSCLGFCTV